MLTRDIIIRGLNQARVTADGQSAVADVELATGLDQLQHLISMNFYAKAHTLGFTKERLTLPVQADGKVVLPPEYANTKEAVYVANGRHPIKLARGSESDALEALANPRMRHAPPDKYVKDYSANGVLSLQIIPPPNSGTVQVVAFKRVAIPTTLDDVIELPPEWETPLIMGLAALLISHYAIKGPAGHSQLTGSLWAAVMAVNGSRGSITLD